jgi:hypothetical protein
MDITSRSYELIIYVDTEFEHMEDQRNSHNFQRLLRQNLCTEFHVTSQSCAV